MSASLKSDIEFKNLEKFINELYSYVHSMESKFQLNDEDSIEVLRISYVYRKEVGERIIEYQWPKSTPIEIPTLSPTPIKLYSALELFLESLQKIAEKINCLNQVVEVAEGGPFYYEMDKLFSGGTKSIIKKPLKISTIDIYICTNSPKNILDPFDSREKQVICLSFNTHNVVKAWEFETKISASMALKLSMKSEVITKPSGAAYEAYYQVEGENISFMLNPYEDTTYDTGSIFGTLWKGRLHSKGVNFQVYSVNNNSENDMAQLEFITYGDMLDNDLLELQ